MKDTCYKKYGVANPAQAEIIKKKTAQAIEKKYGKGITNAWQAKAVKDKSKQTLMKKFGVDNIAKSNYAKQLHKIHEKKTVEKRNNTKRLHKTFNTSAWES